MKPLRRIRADMGDLPDRHLLVVLDALGYDGLVTNNYKMLKVPRELAALHHTTLTLFAVEGCGNDPLRAAGAVMLDLPAATRKIDPKRPQVFFSRPRAPGPKRPWDFLSVIADREGRPVDELFAEVKIDQAEHDEVMTSWWKGQ